MSEETEAIEKRQLTRGKAFDYDDFNTYDQARNITFVPWEVLGDLFPFALGK